MKIRDVGRRLLKLEKKGGAADGVLSFGNGSSRAIRVRDGLGLAVASFRRRHAELEGLPRPESPFNGLLELMGNAENIETRHPLLMVTFGIAREKNSEEEQTT